MNRKKIKEWAKQKTSGNILNVWKPFLVMALILFVTGNFVDIFKESFIGNTIGAIIDIALIPLSIGSIIYMINLVKDKEYNLKMMIEPYNDFIRIFITTFLSWLLVFAGLILFVVPGIILGLGLALVPYLLATRKDLKPTEIIELSLKMMKGHKWEYFVFSLSFLGWSIFAVFTLGILYIWLLPYMTIAFTKYILTIIDEDSIVVA